MITNQQALQIVAELDGVVAQIGNPRGWHAARQQQMMALTEYLQSCDTTTKLEKSNGPESDQSN